MLNKLLIFTLINFKNVNSTVIYRFKLLITITLLSILSLLNVNYLFHINLTTLCVTVLVILLVNIFSYFVTIYSYSKYTTPVKFFWIRVFSLIWFLEFYIFGIFVFLFIISPNELYHFWDFSRPFKLKIPNISNVNTYLVTLISIILINFITELSRYKNTNLINILLLIIILSLLWILINEFKPFLYYCHISNFKTFKIVPKSNTYLNNVLGTSNFSNFIKLKESLTKVKSDDYRHHIPSIFILNLILGIKFVHVFFIIFINFVLISLTYGNNNKVGLTTFGAIQQNLNILLIFWALNYIIYFKFYFKVSVYGLYKSIGLFDFHQIIYLVKNEFYLF